MFRKCVVVRFAFTQQCTSQMTMSNRPEHGRIFAGLVFLNAVGSFNTATGAGALLSLVYNCYLLFSRARIISPTRTAAG